MGNINVSNVNTLIEGETLGYCYDIYRIMELDNNEYFKVEDLSDFDIKLLPIFLVNWPIKSLKHIWPKFYEIKSNKLFIILLIIEKRLNQFL